LLFEQGSPAVKRKPCDAVCYLFIKDRTISLELV